MPVCIKLEGVSLATIIAISTRLKVSSDGFDFVYVLNDPEIINNTFSCKYIRMNISLIHNMLERQFLGYI